MKGHPGRRALIEWASGNNDDLLAHIEACEHCLDELEELTAMQPQLVRTLRRLTLPSPGFIDRLIIRIENRRRRTEVWAAAADLFSLSWRTLDAVTGDEDD